MIPLFEKYEIKMDNHTYQHLIEMYHAKRDFKAIAKLMVNIEKENLEPTFYTLNYYLDTAMRLEDTDMIVEALKKFKKFSKI